MRLSLGWMGKDLSLASADGRYELVDRDDPRVAEVRPLETVELVGDATGGVDDNLLVLGDGADMMRTLVRLPEYAEHYRAKTKLVYIDPPFNTGQAFEHYDDGIEHSVWLTMMRDRLVLIRDLLAPDGSVWVHLDDVEMAYCRVLMDEVFGRSRFVATVIWQKRTSRDNRAAFSPMHDYLLVYSPVGPQRWKDSRNRLPDEGGYSNPDDDPRGPWRSIPMHVQAGRATANQFYEITTPTGVVHSPPDGRAWTYSRPRFEELVAADRVYWPKGGDSRPRLKRFVDEAEGLVPFTFWPASEVGENSSAKTYIQQMFEDVEPFDTPKPERLLQRIIHIATDPGDIVLDAFAGSGTTAAVAHKMGRRWVTSEREQRTVSTFTLPRLQMTVFGHGINNSGRSMPIIDDLPTGVAPGAAKDAARVIRAFGQAEALDPSCDWEELAGLLAEADRKSTEATIEWSGGGGFRVAKLADSIFDVSAGRVYLSPTATNEKFAEGVRAQLGFAALDEPPFCGTKGKMRLAVVDGVADDNVIQVLATKADGGPLTVVAKAVTEGAAELLQELAPGSLLRKAPSGLLRRRVRGVGR